MSPKEQIRLFSGHETNVDLDRLEAEFGKKKKIIGDYRKQILLALSYYPELKDIAIDFVFTESEHPVAAKPKGATTFLPASRRTYMITISTKISRSKEPVLLRNLPFALQVSQFAHELGHVLDYLTMSTVEFLAKGMLYVIAPTLKRKMEQKADREAIKHGFGKQVLEFSKLIYDLQERFPNEKFYFEYHKYYMTPAEIVNEMNRLKIYSQVVD